MAIGTLGWIAIIFGGIGVGFLIVTVPGYLIRRSRRKAENQRGEKREEGDTDSASASSDRAILNR